MYYYNITHSLPKRPFNFT